MSSSDAQADTAQRRPGLSIKRCSTASVRQGCEVIGGVALHGSLPQELRGVGGAGGDFPGQVGKQPDSGTGGPSQHLERVGRADRQLPGEHASQPGPAPARGFAQKPGKRIVECSSGPWQGCPRNLAIAPAWARFSLARTRTRASDAPQDGRVISPLIAL